MRSPRIQEEATDTMLTLVARLRRSARSQQFASAFVARIASAVLGFVMLLVASHVLTPTSTASTSSCSRSAAGSA